MSNIARFGTDGIRGKYGDTLVGNTAYRLGNSVARRARGGEIVVGRDTRPSGIELYKYLAKGILDAGGHIVDMGIVPTPLVSYATSHIGASYGIVITASHNSAEYNGLKVFASSGMKIDGDTEHAIESDMSSDIFVDVERGCSRDGSAYIEDYERLLLDEFSGISGQNIGIDCGNGALSDLAPRIYSRLSKGTIVINDEGNGTIINERSGALHPERLREEVMRHHLDMGFAFDGDGDRITAVTHDGTIVNGDMMLYALALYLKGRNDLTNNIVVGTPYTNMGLEKALYMHGITLVRADVGDSNVALEMTRTHSSLGGERAGHIIMSRYGMTGDALMVALALARIVSQTSTSLSDITSYREYPTLSGDFVVDDAPKVVDMCADIRDSTLSRLGDSGRIIMRASGTEPKVRVMVECIDETLGKSVLDDTITAIKKRCGV